ncbi:MAG: L-lactate dehydrogenase [Syntrophomonadaceae bacterium]|nr:L-lactate dehydrogenase [Bacillota bacterium]
MTKKRGIKISVIGAGLVGSSAAFALMVSGLPSDLVIVDVRSEKAEGEAMDLGDAAAFIKPTAVLAGGFADCRDSDMVIFTAGANQKPGESRLSLLQDNVSILKKTLPELLRYCPEAIYLMVANPVDVLTYAALKISGLPASHVFGSGTVLDTSRFRAELSQYCGVDPRNIHAYVVGEHGDSEVPLWSSANVAGMSLEKFYALKGIEPADRLDIAGRVRMAAYEIIRRKGATYYAIALAVRRICEAVLRDENSILTVSGMVNGITGCCLSLPCIVNGSGRERELAVPMSAEEEKALLNSAQVLRQAVRQAGF